MAAFFADIHKVQLPQIMQMWLQQGSQGVVASQHLLVHAQGRVCVCRGPRLNPECVRSLEIDSGVLLSDGDGTVPLLSLGGLCKKHWQEAKLNPSGIRVVTREYKHDPLAPSKQSPATAISLHFKKLRNLFRYACCLAQYSQPRAHTYQLQLRERSRLWLCTSAEAEQPGMQGRCPECGPC